MTTIIERKKDALVPNILKLKLNMPDKKDIL